MLMSLSNEAQVRVLVLANEILCSPPIKQKNLLQFPHPHKTKETSQSVAVGKDQWYIETPIFISAIIISEDSPTYVTINLLYQFVNGYTLAWQRATQCTPTSVGTLNDIGKTSAKMSHLSVMRWDGMYQVISERQIEISEDCKELE